MTYSNDPSDLPFWEKEKPGPIAAASKFYVKQKRRHVLLKRLDKTRRMEDLTLYAVLMKHLNCDWLSELDKEIIAEELTKLSKPKGWQALNNMIP